MSHSAPLTFVVVFASMGCLQSAPSLEAAISAGKAGRAVYGEFSVQANSGRVFYTSHNGAIYGESVDQVMSTVAAVDAAEVA